MDLASQKFIPKGFLPSRIQFRKPSKMKAKKSLAFAQQRHLMREQKNRMRPRWT
jgi:hypothetical protein